MKHVAIIVLCLALLGVPAAWGEESSEAVPKTYDGAGGAFKEGGKEIGEGFRGIGRGIKDTFTGKSSAEDYKQGKDIGTGFKDLGRGVAGGGRATGRSIKKGVHEGESEK